jgi:AbrB family looped-hinge helix DNA binding protein
MQMTSSITTKGQVTIPKSTSDYFNLQKSDKIVFAVVGGWLVVKPIKKNFLYFGRTVSSKGKSANLQKIRQSVMKKVAEKAAEE